MKKVSGFPANAKNMSGNQGSQVGIEYFMGLSEGKVLVINQIGQNSVLPIFAERVGPMHSRGEQWSRIFKALLNQKLWLVFDCVESHSNYVQDSMRR